MTAAAVTIANPLPAQLVALSAELVARRDELAAIAETLPAITDTDTLAAAEAAFVAVDRFTKQVATDRLVLTRPIDALKAQIIEAERTAVAPLLPLREQVAKAVAAYRAEERRRAEEAARIAREKAEAEARELRRQQEEARRRELEEYEAKKKAAEEEAALFGTPAEPVAPPPVQAPAVLAIAIPEPAAPALPKSAVRTSTRRRCVITDPALILAEACKGGGRLFGRVVLTVDEKAVAELVMAGVAVPGAKVEEYQTIGAAGGRR